jgi:hypothetical protein
MRSSNKRPNQLERYRTAGGSFRYLAHPEQAYFPGFA